MTASRRARSRSAPFRRPPAGTLCAEPLCDLHARCAPHSTAAFLLLGPCGTRATLVPSIPQGSPARVDPAEPARVAEAVRASACRFAALIAATRDDLADGGAAHLAHAIRAVRAAAPGVRVELHAGDLGGSVPAQRALLAARPDLLHHALPACPRLAATAAPGGDYVRSLEWIRLAKEEFEAIRVRATLPLGLGETRDEIVASIADLRSVRVDELILAVAPLPYRKAAPHADLIQRVSTVAAKLGFERIEVLQHARSCVAPRGGARSRE